LAKTLRVSAETLASWLDGHATPPVDIYLKALDLVASGRHRHTKSRGWATRPSAA